MCHVVPSVPVAKDGFALCAVALLLTLHFNGKTAFSTNWGGAPMLSLQGKVTPFASAGLILSLSQSHRVYFTDRIYTRQSD